MEVAMARKHVQPGFFDLVYAALSEISDSLERLAGVMPITLSVALRAACSPQCDVRARYPTVGKGHCRFVQWPAIGGATKLPETCRTSSSAWWFQTAMPKHTQPAR